MINILLKLKTLSIIQQLINLIKNTMPYPYNTKLDIKFKHFEVIDIPEIVKECQDKWFNQTLTEVNTSVVRVGIIEGEYHWHKHEKDDEFFFVLEGKLLIDLEDKTIELTPLFQEM